MSIPEWIDTSALEASFVVANTPSYLVRRFKEDKAPQLLRDKASGDDLVSMFVGAIASEPGTMRELVAPYLFLCALAFKPDIKFLRAASEKERNPAYKWLPQFAEILIQEYRPLVVKEFRPNVAINPAISLGSNASVNNRTLTMFNR
jgi:hypothetical protein